MLVTREFTNHEVADRLEHVATGFRLGMARPEDHMGMFAEAVTRLRGLKLADGSPAPGLNEPQAVPAVVREGLSIHQEPKYTVNGCAIVNRATGEEIPHDEPVFIFRARDEAALTALCAYEKRIKDRAPQSDHAGAIADRIWDFKGFAETHPDRMKWPDTAAPTEGVTAVDGQRDERFREIAMKNFADVLEALCRIEFPHWDNPRKVSPETQALRRVEIASRAAHELRKGRGG